MRRLVLTSLLGIACTTAEPGPDTPTLARMVGDCDGGTPLFANGEPEPGGAHPVGDLSVYSTRLRIRDASSGFVRARADAHWASEDLRNVLGYLPAGAVVWAQGPLKDTDGSGGIGWAVPVEDLDGATCRTYLSYTVVDPVPEAASQGS